MNINPYQPTNEVSETRIADARDPSTIPWGVFDVYWRTVLAVMIAGISFGGVMGLFAVAASRGDEMGYVVGAAVLIPIGGVIGGIFSLIAGVPAVAILLPVFMFGNLGCAWSRTRVLWFAAVGGFVSGFLSISVPVSFDPGAMAFSLLPGTFGAVVSLLAMRYMSRKMPGLFPQDTISSKPDRTSESTPLSIPVDAI